MKGLSVVPARLEYACGHAALVTLPSVKGERAQDRAARIQSEKAAALQRSCDFCETVVVEVAEVNHVPEPIAPVAEVVVETAAEPLPQAESPAAAPEPAPVPELAPAPAPVRKRAPAPVRKRAPAPVPVLAPAAAPAPLPRAVRVPARRRVTPVHNGSAGAAGATKEFRISYISELVVEADNIGAAIHKAEVLGAREIRSIARVP